MKLVRGLRRPNCIWIVRLSGEYGFLYKKNITISLHAAYILASVIRFTAQFDWHNFWFFYSRQPLSWRGFSESDSPKRIWVLLLLLLWVHRYYVISTSADSKFRTLSRLCAMPSNTSEFHILYYILWRWWWRVDVKRRRSLYFYRGKKINHQIAFHFIIYSSESDVYDSPTVPCFDWK